MKMRTVLLAILSCVLLWAVTASAAAQQKEHAYKVGKKGDISLAQPTKVGDKTLEPGTYLVQHRVSHGDHFVRLIELKQVGAQSTDAGYYTYTERDKVGEVKCRLEPAAGPIKETTVYTVTDGGVQRVTKIAIKGEDVLHVL
jgi:hypothetical protein